VAKASGVVKVPSASSFTATELDRALHDRTDKACLDVDPELFSIDGDERTALIARQIESARRVCGSCPALALCQAAALCHDDPWTFQGGLSPRERLARQTASAS
jgi:hypothetical protein